MHLMINVKGGFTLGLACETKMSLHVPLTLSDIICCLKVPKFCLLEIAGVRMKNNVVALFMWKQIEIDLPHSGIMTQS